MIRRPFASMLIALVLTQVSPDSLLAATTPMFQYQGFVKVQGQPFTGPGQFRFAIVSNDGNSTLWSNDGTSTAGQEPTGTPITLSVTSGVFNVIIGDPATGQQPINPVILIGRGNLKLRTWFSDGIHGFQQLNPDIKLINLLEATTATDNSDFTLYVNGGAGSDENNGLTTGTAKKTIQAALDTLPARLNANVTVQIAAGTYRERVLLHGITTIPGKTLLITGESAWNLNSPGNPATIVTGADEPAMIPVRDSGIYIRVCDRIVIRNLYMRYTAGNGLIAENSVCEVQNCLFMNNTANGALGQLNATLLVSNCRAQNNTSSGFNINSRSNGTMDNCEAIGNGSSGFMLQNSVLCNFKTRVLSRSNGASGIQVWVYSLCYLNDGLTGEIRDNGAAGMHLAYYAHVQNYNNTLGNGNVQVTSNTEGALVQLYGGVKFW